mmetsp:Transcript_5396/g.14487  ORF Transcript_5396/g.14487 Transcript_5396/m.14487 type:complete len:579 (-) Transcript_5396:256-1992(-)
MLLVLLFVTALLHAALGLPIFSAKHCPSLKHEKQKTHRVLCQTDFDQGTVIIDQPGSYLLGENITFNPNSRENGGDCMPRIDQFSFMGGPYDPAAYGIGFFAAISIIADNVELDLNGFTLQQGVEHNLIQRFFALIELGSTPFLSGFGPHDFGSFQAPKNVEIKNGILGLSAHHALHGNLAEHVRVHDVVMQDWAVAAISINGGRDIWVKNVEVGPNTKKVPVTALFSTAQFILRYVRALATCTDAVELVGLPSIASIEEELVELLETTYQAVVVRRQPELVPQLFRNHGGFVDGNVYGMVFNVLGPAVGGLFTGIPDGALGNSGIHLEKVSIVDVAAIVPEIVALSTLADESKPEVDPVGSVFQAANSMLENGTYVGNVVADAQLLVAKNILRSGATCFARQMLSTTRNSISTETIEWAEGGSALQNRRFLYGGDALFHVNKGVFGLRMDGALRSSLKHIFISKIRNLALPRVSLCSSMISDNIHPGASESQYMGSASRGLVLSSVSEVCAQDVKISDISSANAQATGFEVLHQSSHVIAHIITTNIVSARSAGDAQLSRLAATARDSQINIKSTSV